MAFAVQIVVEGVAGTAGVAVSVSVLSLESNVISELSGNVNKAVNVTVYSGTGYEKITAATLTVSGGTVAVGAPVSVVRSACTAESFIAAPNVTAIGTVSVLGDHKLDRKSVV